jgi:hypothetical protein
LTDREALYSSDDETIPSIVHSAPNPDDLLDAALEDMAVEEERDLSQFRNEFPPSWRKVIDTDATRQELSDPQRPFSDAYLDGQPEAKRRRIDFSNADVSTRLAKSIKKFAKVDDNTAETMAHNASSTLTPLYREQFHNDITDLLSRDEDFSNLSSRYPNTVSQFGTPEKIKREAKEKKDEADEQEKRKILEELHEEGHDMDMDVDMLDSVLEDLDNLDPQF